LNEGKKEHHRIPSKKERRELVVWDKSGDRTAAVWEGIFWFIFSRGLREKGGGWKIKMR